MIDNAAPMTPEATLPDEVEGDFATGERTEPKADGTELHEGDFAAGERTMPDPVDAGPEDELHGDFAAGERTEAAPAADADEGTFAS